MALSALLVSMYDNLTIATEMIHNQGWTTLLLNVNIKILTALLESLNHVSVLEY